MASAIFIITLLLAVCTSRIAAESQDTRFLVFLKVPVPCAGAIVAPNWVITAAHCCYNSSNAKEYRMLAGSQLHYQHRQGDQLYIHPNGTADQPQVMSKACNFALLKVTPGWNIGQYVRVIHMFFGQFPRYPILNNGCFAAGWNRYAQHDGTDNTMPVPSAYRLTTVVSEQCRKKLNRAVYENNVCAQDQFGSWDGSASFGVYPCAGDVGGPLVCDIFTDDGQLKPMLTGVMSSYETAEVNDGMELCRLSFYAETVSLSSWIRDHVPHIEREGVDEPLRSRIMGVQDVRDVASASASSLSLRAGDADKYALSVFHYSGVTVAVVGHGTPARRLVAIFLANLSYMRIVTLLVLVINIFDNDRAWCRFGYIVAI